MTVASGYFDSITQSGSGSSWQDLSNLKSGGEAYSPARSGTEPLDLLMYTMGEIDAVANGSQFEEMTVEYRDKAEGFTGTITVRWEGTVGGISKTGTSYSHAVATGGFGVRSYSGDAAYWGLDSVTPSALFTAIRDGTLKFKYRINPTGWSGEDTAYLKEVEFSITYTEVDTKRAAILACVP